MYVLRRWWTRYRNWAVLAGLALGSAWAFKQTDGAIVFEAYSRLSRPFQLGEAQQGELTDARVLELQQRLAEVEQENSQLRNLLDYESEIGGEPVFAPVVGRSADRWWQQIVLGRGTAHDIEVGDVVAAPGGAIGRVVSTTENSSRVLLVSDPSSRVGVTVNRSRAMGVLRGRSSDRATIEFFEKVPDIKEGDAILTSRYSPRFPSGLPIGTVVEVNLNASPTPQAEVQLSAPLSSLEWVAIYPQPSKGLPTESAEPVEESDIPVELE